MVRHRQLSTLREEKEDRQAGTVRQAHAGWHRQAGKGRHAQASRHRMTGRGKRGQADKNSQLGTGREAHAITGRHRQEGTC